MDTDARSLDALADLSPFGPRQLKPEVVEAPLSGVDGVPRGDEVQQIAASRRLKEDHAPMRERDLETEDVDVETLGGDEVSALEREVAQRNGGGLRQRARNRSIRRALPS